LPHGRHSLKGVTAPSNNEIVPTYEGNPPGGGNALCPRGSWVGSRTLVPIGLKIMSHYFGNFGNKLFLANPLCYALANIY